MSLGSCKNCKKMICDTRWVCDACVREPGRKDLYARATNYDKLRNADNEELKRILYNIYEMGVMRKDPKNIDLWLVQTAYKEE